MYHLPEEHVCQQPTAQTQLEFLHATGHAEDDQHLSRSGEQD